MKSNFSCNLSFIDPQSAHFGLKSLKKNPVISLYWFAAQQKTSTLLRQTDSKFSVEPNGFVSSFSNEHNKHEVAQKYQNNGLLMCNFIKKKNSGTGDFLEVFGNF